ncbi:MAG: hypothetical protein ACYDBV_13485 [Nitrospiria bacterium]
MATPRLNRLAQRFMQQIQDPITVSNGIIQPGNIIRSVAEIENYLGIATMEYLNSFKLKGITKRGFVNEFPELYTIRNIQFTRLEGISDDVLAQITDDTGAQVTQDIDVTLGNNFIDLTGLTFFDLFDILDSVYYGVTNVAFEAWDVAKLPEALTGYNPFYIGNNVRAGIIYQDNKIWVFPPSILSSNNFTFSLHFLIIPVNRVDGTYFTSGGGWDYPFSERHIEEIANIATKLYRTDDAEAQSAG